MHRRSQLFAVIVQRGISTLVDTRICVSTVLLLLPTVLTLRCTDLLLQVIALLLLRIPLLLPATALSLLRTARLPPPTGLDPLYTMKIGENGRLVWKLQGFLKNGARKNSRVWFKLRFVYESRHDQKLQKLEFFLNRGLYCFYFNGQIKLCVFVYFVFYPASQELPNI